jgi:hypothetical protein
MLFWLDAKNMVAGAYHSILKNEPALMLDALAMDLWLHNIYSLLLYLLLCLLLYL